MEPIELAASIAGILQLSAKVTVLVGQCYEEVHGVPETLRLFDETLKSLGDSLQRINETTANTTSDAERQHRDAIERISDECLKILEDLLKGLPELEENPNLFKQVAAAFKVKINEKAIREKLDAIQRYSDQVAISLGALQM